MSTDDDRALSIEGSFVLPNAESVTIRPWEQSIKFVTPDGRTILHFREDGTVEGDADGMPEAAQMFVREVVERWHGYVSPAEADRRVEAARAEGAAEEVRAIADFCCQADRAMLHAHARHLESGHDSEGRP